MHGEPNKKCPEPIARELEELYIHVELVRRSLPNHKNAEKAGSYKQNAPARYPLSLTSMGHLELTSWDQRNAEKGVESGRAKRGGR